MLYNQYFISEVSYKQTLLCACITGSQGITANIYKNAEVKNIKMTYP